MQSNLRNIIRVLSLVAPVHVVLFLRAQALACCFPWLILLGLGITRHLHVLKIARYDLLLVYCLLLQIWMFRRKMETWDEVKVIILFHITGLVLEIYKTQMHSWQYPDPGWAKIGSVPLFSGFMYASIASYLCQAWRRLQVQITDWPRAYWTIPLVLAIYLNFFTEHFLPDARWLLTLLIVIIFYRTQVSYVLGKATYQMPLPLAFLLIGFFVWIGENCATYLGAWQYPNQRLGWHMVHSEKISSWSLLVIVSFIAVAQLKHIKEKNVPIVLEIPGSEIDRTATYPQKSPVMGQG